MAVHRSEMEMVLDPSTNQITFDGPLIIEVVVIVTWTVRNLRLGAFALQ